MKHGEISLEEKSAGMLLMLYCKSYLLTKKRDAFIHFNWQSCNWSITAYDIGMIILMKHEANRYFHIDNVGAIKTSPLYFANAALCLVSTYNK